jgi:hypothetical protein
MKNLKKKKTQENLKKKLRSMRDKGYAEKAKEEF